MQRIQMKFDLFKKGSQKNYLTKVCYQIQKQTFTIKFERFLTSFTNLSSLKMYSTLQQLKNFKTDKLLDQMLMTFTDKFSQEVKLVLKRAIKFIP